MKQITANEIRDFDIMLTASKSLLSRIIRKIIKARASHAAVFFKLDGILYVYESEKHGLTNTDFIKHYSDSNNYDIWIARPKTNVNKKNSNELLHLAVSTAGHKPYDYINLLVHQPVKFITKRLFGKAMWVGKRKKRADKRFVCSELVAYVMNKFFKLEPDWNEVSTEHFFSSDNYKVYKYVKK